MTTLRDVVLENGLKIIFNDESNRYFGDYHRICLAVSICCSLEELQLESEEDKLLRQRALDKFGATLTVMKHVERMGVASEDVEAVRTSMIDDFLRHTSEYLSRPDYPLSMMKSELNRKPVQRFYV